MRGKTDIIAEVGLHVFERAGLSHAPYRYIGCTENMWVSGCGTVRKPGGACDYCGNSILFEHWLQGADGKKFKVGSDCIARASDAGLLKAYKSHPETRKKQREQRRATDARKTAELDHIIAQYHNRLQDIAHPFLPQLSLLEYAQWMRLRAGATGRAKTLKVLRDQLQID